MTVLRIMTHNQNSHLLQTHRPILQPSHGLMIQMIRRLVHEHNVRIDQHRRGQSHFHLPPTRNFADGAPRHCFREFQLAKDGLACLLALADGREKVPYLE